MSGSAEQCNGCKLYGPDSCPVHFENAQKFADRTPADETAARTQERVRTLAQRGANIDPSVFGHTMIVALIDELIGERGTARREAFELKLHASINKVLDDLETEIRRATLLQGVHVDPRGNGGRS